MESELVARNRITQEKTNYWQQIGPAVNHFNNAGVRPRGAFVPVFNAILSQIPKASKILDVGCGHGRLAIPLAEAGHSVTATDVSRKMLDMLEDHKGGLPIEVRLGDAHRVPAGEGEFDVVLSSDFMPHFPDWRRLLEEKARVCKLGGLVLFAFNFTEHKIYAAPFGGAGYDHPYSPELNSGKPFWAECTLDEMTAAAGNVGLTLKKAVPIKCLIDSFAFGGALGGADYRKFQTELSLRLNSNPAVAEFYGWLEKDLFQRLPFFFAYSSLVVFERDISAGRGTGDPVKNFLLPVPESLRGCVSSSKQNSLEISDQFLSEIPSETSLAERRYLHDFFAKDWDGSGEVVEIGPFLGGTTRAIASGMYANPRRASGGRLQTFDRFDNYYSAVKLRETIEPMVRGGVFTADEASSLCRDANFERLFEALHAPHAYGQLVRIQNSELPDRPEEIDSSNALASLAKESELGALFVDGCKSWASTHYTLKVLLPRLQRNAPVIFQDFGWYTCFWISSAAYALRDYLTAESHVDSTYAFRLTRPVSEQEVSERFSRTPVEMGDLFFAEAAEALRERSLAIQDLRGELISYLHHVAALATLGDVHAAATILKGLNVQRFLPVQELIWGCLKSPTYLPGGKQILWE